MTGFSHPPFFSVATTSTKSPPVIKADIRRVLDRMQVQYHETRSGFECIHLPSIDMSSVQNPPPVTPSRHAKGTGAEDTPQARKSMVRKTSKLSFGLGSRDRPSTADTVKANGEKELPTRPSVGAATLATSPSSGSSSFFNVSSTAAHTAPADGIRLADLNGTTSTATPVAAEEFLSHPAKSKHLPPIPKDFTSPPAPRAISPTSLMPLPTGEVDKDVFDSMGANTLSVRFEINIVKVSLRANESCHNLKLSFAGPMVTATWHSIPQSRWRWMAVPDARTSSSHRVKTMTTMIIHESNVVFQNSSSVIVILSRDS